LISLEFLLSPACSETEAGDAAQNFVTVKYCPNFGEKVNYVRHKLGLWPQIRQRSVSPGAAMLRKLSELGEAGAFGPDEVRILVAAFDAAWETVKASGAPFSEPDYEETARDILAKWIIYAAKIGERDERMLTEGALLQLSRANLRRR
jgi:hypothetical protein